MKKQKITRLNGKLVWLLAAGAATLASTASCWAASQTWTNAPVNQSWANTNNWVGRAVPGVLNQTGNTTSGDVATFNSAIPLSGIGSAALPIIPDDATTNNTSGPRSREISGITFDTANCGAYVIYSPSPVQLTTNSPQTGVLWVSHNGSIQMTATVTNTETILVPLRVILPSSTAGKFSLINNSTNPNSQLLINSITHGGANTRATTFVLDGANTALNVVTNLSEGTSTSGAGGFTKQGTCTWMIAGPSTFPAGSPLNVNQGVLRVEDPNAFGLVTTTANVNSNATLQIDNVTLNPLALVINLNQSGTVRMNGSQTINGINVGTAIGTSPTVATTSASDVLTLGAVGNKILGGSAYSTLHIAGPGTVYLGNDTIYAGKWSVDAGTLQVASSVALGTGAVASVSAGGILDLSPLGAITYYPSVSGIGGAGNGTAVGSTAAVINGAAGEVLDLVNGGVKSLNLTFTPTSASGDTAHPALYLNQLSLVLGGNLVSVNNASGTPLGAGTYTLATVNGGTITDGGNYSVLVSGSGLAANTEATLQITGGNINLVVGAYVAKNLVWQGNINGNWDTGITSNWLNGASSTVFNTSDNVTFNSVGAAQSTVTLINTLLPATVTVDTSGGNYTFTGSGQFDGDSSLTKSGTGTLSLGTVNTYAGGTVINGGVLQVGVPNAISSTGSGDVQLNSPATLDLNGNNQAIDALIGNGTVDTVSGGAPTLTIGSNDRSGTFSGTLQNTAGTLAVAKTGIGTETFSGNNTYTGGTTVSQGTLRVTTPSALGPNTNDAVVVSGGTLDVGANLVLSSLTGSGGTVANNSTATTNTITIQSTTSPTFSGVIADGTGGGGIALRILGGTFTIAGSQSTYTGGTFVGTNTTFNLANAPAGITGPLVASNNATLGLTGGSNPPGTPTTVTTVDGATVYFNSGALGKVWNTAFYGSANTTNIFDNNVSFGVANCFQNFLGTVVLNTPAGNQIRFSGAGVSAADNATFNVISGTELICNGPAAQTVSIGQLLGGGVTGAGIGGAHNGGASDTWIIGSKSLDSKYEGYINANSILVKSGTGKLTLDGVNYLATNTDSATFTNYVYGQQIAYTGSTTVSNGVLAIVAPNNLTNSPAITLANTNAVLDASLMGGVDYFSDVNGTNSSIVTNGTLEILSGQSLNGYGSIRAQNVLLDAGSTLNPGNAAGSVVLGDVTGVLAFNSPVSISSAVTMRLNRTNTVNADEISAPNLTINPTATLTVTNIGTAFQGGEVFHLFNQPVTGFATVNLPTVTSPLSLTNKLAVDGTLAVLGTLVNTNPAPITTTFNGNTVTLNWPVDHIGWTLQVQTNAPGTGLTGNWVDVAGSTSVNTTNFPITPANGSVFYRLKY